MDVIIDNENNQAAVVRTRSPRKRSAIMCGECRARKQKCLPIGRDWSKKERCDECVRRGVDCGPSKASPRRERAAKALRLRGPASGRPPEVMSSPPTTADVPFFDSSPSARLETHLLARNLALDNGELRPTFPESRGVDLLVCDQVTDSASEDGSSSGYRKVIQDKLASLHLSKYCDAYLHNREHAVDCLRQATRFAFGREDEQCCNLVSTCLNVAIRSSKDNLAHNSKLIIDYIKKLDPSEREGPLLRLGSIHEEHAATCEGLLPPPFRPPKIACLPRQHKILRLLIETYEEQGDHKEASRLRQQLNMSQTGHQSTPSDSVLEEEVEVFQEISIELQDIFHNPNPGTSTISNDKKFPPIQIALLWQCNTVAAHLLKDIGPPLNDLDMLGRNLLHILAELSHLAFLKFLIDRKPGLVRGLLPKRDCWSLTPLLVAAYSGNIEFFKALTDAGGDLKDKDGQGRGLLYYASAAGNGDAVVRYLLDQGIPPNDNALRTGSPLDAAAAGGYLEVVQLLVHRGASVLPGRPGGTKPEDLARKNNHIATAECLADMAVQEEICRFADSQPETDNGNKDSDVPHDHQAGIPLLEDPHRSRAKQPGTSFDKSPPSTAVGIEEAPPLDSRFDKSSVPPGAVETVSVSRFGDMMQSSFLEKTEESRANARHGLEESYQDLMELGTPVPWNTYVFD